MSDTNDVTTTILGLLKKFISMAEERAKTLPYGINLIETLGGACETENSKILAAILRYKSPAGRFEILESLIDYIQSRFDAFHEISVGQPSINTEHCHIDVYVREACKYAVIVENKSNWAGDQNHQLSRYIKTAIREGFKENQIYVLYLPPLEVKGPEGQSWGEYEKSFKNRYVKLSWREDILPWMKGKVLPNVRNKDIPLSSALEQYVDYWEGQFGLRGVENEVKMKMRETVIEGLALGFEQDAGKSLEIIRDAYVNAQSLTETLAVLANERKSKLEFRFWQELIGFLESRGYGEIKCINITENAILKNYSDKGWYGVGFQVNFTVNERPFVFDCQASKDAGFYGFKFMAENGTGEQISRPSVLNEQSKLIEKIVKGILPNSKPFSSWYGCVVSPDLDFRQMWFKTIIDRLGTREKSMSYAQSWADRFAGYIKDFENQIIEESVAVQRQSTEPQL